MTSQHEVEYTVLLVFPGFGAERENAESVVESAIDWLNTFKETPGFRFASPVSARLQMVQDADEARALIEADESIAVVIMHDLSDDERDGLVWYCEGRNIGTCFTVDVPRQGGRPKGPMKVVVRQKRAPDELPSHTLNAETLTGPVAEDEETNARVGEVIAVLALGVMMYHWNQNPR